jgi:type I restriction enzyme M protein
MAKKAKEAEEIGSSRELYNFLYEACNILRGPVSQDAFKEYITPLLYFKRISDVYDEETQAALQLVLWNWKRWAMHSLFRYRI